MTTLVTAEIERYDGEPINDDDLRDALRAAGYRLSSYEQGALLSAKRALRQAVGSIESAATLLRWDESDEADR